MAERTPAKKTTAKKAPARRKASSSTADSPADGGGDPVELHDERPGVEPGDARTAYITLNSGRVRAVQYEVIDGQAVVESDIVLGTVEEVERQSELHKAEMRGELSFAAVITGNQFRWPNCTVPYTIDSGLPNQARVTNAIAHWEDRTNFTFVLRTSANASQYPDFVTFQPSTGCSSAVGRRGGQQFINLAAGCTTGNAIHEIGHAIGFWHEQSREDRDAFVTINWANIESGREHNFNQHITDGDDVGAYDYGSIMHYPRDAFSRNGLDTIVPTNPPGSAIGQRTALSAGDIAAANAMCPGTITPTVKELVKERLPEHTLKELTVETAKERYPETIKELAPETVKERYPETIKELAPETFKERSPEPPVTWVEQIRPELGGRVVNPVTVTRGVTPFAARASGVSGVGDAAAAERAGLEADVEALAQAYLEGEASLQAIGTAYEATVARLAELEGG